MRIRYCTVCWSRINDSVYEQARRASGDSLDASATSRYCYDCYCKMVGEPLKVTAGAASSEPVSATTRRKPK